MLGLHGGFDKGYSAMCGWQERCFVLPMKDRPVMECSDCHKHNMHLVPWQAILCWPIGNVNTMITHIFY